MDPTTTVATPTEGAGAPAQPTEGAQPTAAQPQEPQSPTSTQPAQADDEYAAWLQSKGLTPDGEQAEKAAKMAYNSEKLMSKATAEASELRKSLTPTEPQQPVPGSQLDPRLEGFIADYQRDKMLNGFKESHPDWKQYDEAMGTLMYDQVQTPYGTFTRGQLVNAGFMSLDDVYKIAKGASPVDTQAIRAQAQQETLQTLANTQRAGGGNAQASNPNPQASTEDPITAAIRKARG